MKVGKTMITFDNVTSKQYKNGFISNYAESRKKKCYLIHNSTPDPSVYFS